MLYSLPSHLKHELTYQQGYAVQFAITCACARAYVSPKSNRIHGSYD